jgi:hypothetical protein
MMYYIIIRAQNLILLKSIKYACTYVLKKVQICFKNMHLIFFNAKMFITNDILLNILVHNSTNVVSILYYAKHNF